MMQGSLARKLRVLRAERGWTLRDASARSGVTKETLSDLERGLRHPHDPTLAKIAKGYGVSFEELLEEEPTRELVGAGPKAEAPDQGRPAPVTVHLEPLELKGEALPVEATTIV